MSREEDPAGHVLDVLARRGALEVFRLLAGGPLGERQVVSRCSAVAASVVTQRIEDLRRLGVVETVPETGDLRLSPEGRRLQGVLDDLRRWASRGS